MNYMNFCTSYILSVLASCACLLTEVGNVKALLVMMRIEVVVGGGIP